MLTFCRSNTGVFPTSQVSYSFHILTFSSAQMVRYTFALRQTTLFAENSAISDEYGLAALANNRLIRHRFGTKFSLHVRSAN